MKHLFVVDDEKEIRLLLKRYLEKEGYRVSDFSSGEYVLQELQRLNPDLMILDITMPGIDGIELCKEIRKNSNIPIVFVSARSEEIDRIVGLEVGGDDYLTKPFSPRELIIRIRNIFKRMEGMDRSPKGHETVSIDELVLDMGARRLAFGGLEIRMTGKELETMFYLMNNVNIALSRGQILEHVWGYEMDIEGRIVDDVIKRIRKKLGEVQTPVRITTVWGYGYKIEEE